MDLDAYFARLGYAGPKSADLATLRALHYLHIQTIPFENLDVLLGRRIDMGEDAVARKLVRDKRGGYCFEHNTLFAAVLRELGFQVESFKNNLVVTLVKDQARLSINNREFVVRQLDGTALKHDIRTPAELIELLARRFGLHFDPGTAFHTPWIQW